MGCTATARPGPSPHASAWAAVGLAAVVVVLATGIQLLRQAGQGPWDTVWAEDGVPFFTEATSAGLGENLLRPYAGYAHVVPRILTQVGAELPVSWYAPWMAVSAALLLSLLALFTYGASRPLLRSPLRQGVLAATVVLLPVLPWEVLATGCNVQWGFALPCLLALLFPVARPGPVAVRGVLAVAGPLTSPLAAMLAPVAAWQLVAGIRRRHPVRALVVPALYLVSSAVQAAVVLGAPQAVGEGPGGSSLVVDLAKLYATKVATDLALGVRVTEWAWPTLGYGLAALAVVAVGGLVAVKLWRGSTACRRWVVGLLAASAVTFVAQVVPRSGSIPLMLSDQDGPYSFAGSRWEVLPALLVVLALLVPLDTRPGLTAALADEPARLAPLAGGLPWRGLVAVVAVWAAVALAPSFRYMTDRGDDPPWSAQVAEALRHCEGQPPETLVGMVISPGWPLAVTCGQLR